MARLPQPGGDAGNWGEILNEFLRESLDAEGGLNTDTVGAPQLKPQSVTAAAIADRNVTAAKLATGTATDGQILSYNGGNLQWATPADSPEVSADEVAETANHKIMTGSERTKLADITASSTELNYLQGSTSSIQTQLDSKGNVNGPTSSVNNTLARFDGTTGKLLKNSAVIVDDTGSLTTTSTNSLQLRTIGTVSGSAGGSGIGVYNNSGAVQTLNNRLGFVLFGGVNNVGSVLANSAGVFSYADATWTGSSTPTRIEFEVAPEGSIARSTAMTIKSHGGVGIGTVSPAAKLDVQGEARVSVAGASATSVVTVEGSQALKNKTVSGASNTLTDIAQSSVTNLTTDLAAKANVSSMLTHGMGVVVHGTDATAARPTEYAVITWIGSVAPTNAATNDVWIHKA